MNSGGGSSSTIRLGLLENWPQFTLLMVVNAFVGGMVGLERTVTPLIGAEEFHIASASTITAFIASFGLVKAFSNLLTGQLADRYGRKALLVTGWLIGLPVPFILGFGPSWGWIVAANVLLGVNQGFCWSTTVMMKIDLVGPKGRGLAVGLNESAGYMALGLTAFLTGYLAERVGLRMAPFYFGVCYAVLGLLLSALLVRDTRGHVATEVEALGGHSEPAPSFWAVFRRTSYGDRNLFAACQAGLINNLNDGMSWGLLPIFFASFSLDLDRIGALKGLYPMTWGLVQIVTGPLSDRWGRKGLIVWGMWVQAAALLLTVTAYGIQWWIFGAVLMGVGTAMVYPALIASVSDNSHPSWRARSLSVYRFWRDLGYAVGALCAGLIADLFGISVAIAAAAGVTFLSGAVTGLVMREHKPA